MQTQLRHAHIILPDGEIPHGSVVIEGDQIVDIVEGDVAVSDCAVSVDLTGYTLMPGMVDLHCDAIEKEVEPRGGVYFPIDFACTQVDKRNAAAGITTIFHALSFADEELGVRSNEMAAEIARTITRQNAHALVDNRVHCRYEITDEHGLPIIEQLIEEGCLSMVSMMDHTPGQGQFKNIEAYQAFFQRNYQRSAEEIAATIDRKVAQAQSSSDRMVELIETAIEAKIAVASHDDDCLKRVELVSRLGASISEFPVSVEAASAAKTAGMYTVFGAPNILRGKSQSGSIRALDAIQQSLADCLCADYSPASMLAAVFRLPELSELDLPAAVRLVATNPAEAAGLYDRGSIAVGQRADLVAVKAIHDIPQVKRTWSAGNLVYQVHYP